MAFAGLAEVFHNEHWNKMFDILRKVGLNFRDTRIIFSLYKEQIALISVKDRERQTSVTKGIKPACSLSPFLFNIYVTETMNEVKDKFIN